MMFMIVYKKSMVEPYFVKRYKSRKCAENWVTKRRVRTNRDDFAVYSTDEYNAAIVGKGEWKTSINGKRIWVPMGTPACCDPSTETYWSM